jgi:hypothetical protein
MAGTLFALRRSGDQAARSTSAAPGGISLEKRPPRTCSEILARSLKKEGTDIPADAARRSPPSKTFASKGHKIERIPPDGNVGRNARFFYEQILRMQTFSW